MEYKCLHKIRHDGIEHNTGDVIHLDDHEAKPLLECKAVELVKNEHTLGALKLDLTENRRG